MFSLNTLTLNPSNTISGHNAIATVLTFAIALAWLKGVNWMAAQGWMRSSLSRKVIHMGMGPLFVLCWLLFSESTESRFLAALVPLSLTLVFFATGMGWLKNTELVQSSTRHGDPNELLKGPFYYGVVFVVCTILFWRHSPIGILALMMMCGGDGLADIIGRRFGSRKLPFNSDKSWAGSGAMWMGSLLFGYGYLALFNALGQFSPALNLQSTFLWVALIALIATGVEALPVKDLDNLTLTAVVIGLGFLVF